MADIVWVAKLTLTEGVVTMTNSTSSKNQTRESTLTHVHHTIQAVGFAAAEAVSTGDVVLTKQHIILLQNLDPTNFVTVTGWYDVSTSVVCGILLPGEFFNTRAELQTAGYPCFKVQADTAACDVEVIVSDAGDPAA